MVKSMTGWGKGDFAIAGDSFTVEVKTLNHRFIDISARFPERFSPMETRIRDEIKKAFARGSFSVHIYSMGSENSALKLNLPMAGLYLEAARELKDELGVKGEVDVATLLRQKDIFAYERKGPFAEEDWLGVRDGLQAALAQVGAWRQREGESLSTDLFSRLATIETFLLVVEERIPKMLEAYRDRLKAEMDKVLAGKFEDSRILLEAAIFAEKTDTAEEATKPGMAEMMAVGVLTHHLLVSTLASGAMAAGSEAFTAGVDADARRTAQEIVKQLGQFFVAQGWIPASNLEWYKTTFE